MSRGVALTARLVVLVSGEGTTLQALLEACEDPEYGARVVGVGSDRPGIRALDRAQQWSNLIDDKPEDLSVFVVRFEDCADRDEFDWRLADAIGLRKSDLVVCAGFMRLLGPQVLQRFRVVNTHPSLLPAFPGRHAIRDALRAGVRYSGVTIHVVDEGIDTGPILAQRAVEVLPDDDEDTLRERIQAVERPLYVEVIGQIVRDGWPAWVEDLPRQPPGAAQPPPGPPGAAGGGIAAYEPDEQYAAETASRRAAAERGERARQDRIRQQED